MSSALFSRIGIDNDDDFLFA